MPEISPITSPLDALITRDHPVLAAQFAKGSSVIRAALSSIDSEASLLLTPLRGAMPVTWCAEGIENDKPLPTTVELPIGEFIYYSDDGKQRTTSPNPHQKFEIIRSRLQDVDLPDRPRLFLLDEVQKGGTISTAIDATRRASKDLGLQLMDPVSVIAAQDSRRKVMSQTKKAAYRKLASNSVADTLVTVVPMPLISTDRAPLLDELRLDRPLREGASIANILSVVRNRKSESLFRALGSMARDEELRHDQNFVGSLIDKQGLVTDKAANRVEDWFDRLISALDEFALER